MTVNNSTRKSAIGTESKSAGIGRTGHGWWQAGGIALVAATLANLAVRLVGGALGGSFVIDDGGQPHEVTALAVAQFTVVPLAVGFGAAMLLALAWPGFLRLAQVVGAVLAVATVAGPFMSDTDVVTQVGLAIMHLVAGVAVVWALEMVRRRRLAVVATER